MFVRPCYYVKRKNRAKCSVRAGEAGAKDNTEGGGSPSVLCLGLDPSFHLWSLYPPKSDQPNSLIGHYRWKTGTRVSATPRCSFRNTPDRTFGFGISTARTMCLLARNMTDSCKVLAGPSGTDSPSLAFEPAGGSTASGGCYTPLG